jgi:6-phosphofructokinase 2
MSVSVVTITMNPAVDKSSSIQHVVPERKLRCTIPLHEPGGGGINVSRALRELGGISHAVFPAGGYTGEHLRELLVAEGVDCTVIDTKGWTRENLIVFEELSGMQYRFGMPGPKLFKKEWHKCLVDAFKNISAPGYVVASGSLPPGVPDDFYAVLANKAKKRGLKVVLDTAGEPLRLALNEGVFLIKPNLGELRDMTGDELCDDRCQDEAVMDIVRGKGAEAVVVSLGAAGTVLATKDGVTRLRAPAVRVRSKVGAGDSMVAGIVLGLVKGEPMDRAAKRGVAAGSAAVMSHGTGLCRRIDAERLLDAMS